MPLITHYDDSNKNKNKNTQKKRKKTPKPKTKPDKCWQECHMWECKKCSCFGKQLDNFLKS